MVFHFILHSPCYRWAWSSFHFLVDPLGFRTSVRCFFISFTFFHTEIFFLIWEFSTYYGYYPLLVICLGNIFSQSAVYISIWFLWLPQGQRSSLLSKCVKICILYLVLDSALIFVSTSYLLIYCFSKCSLAPLVDSVASVIYRFMYMRGLGLAFLGIFLYLC